MNNFFKEKYNEYYSLKKLINDMNKKNIDLKLLDFLELNNLFILGVENGLVDLVEYLYIFKGCEYELGELLSLNSTLTTSYEETNTLLNVIVHDSGANSGLNLQYLDNHNKQIQKSISKLVNLRRYSKLRIQNKKYYYKFNVKHINKIFDY